MAVLRPHMPSICSWVLPPPGRPPIQNYSIFSGKIQHFRAFHTIQYFYFYVIDLPELKFICPKYWLGCCPNTCPNWELTTMCQLVWRSPKESAFRNVNTNCISRNPPLCLPFYHRNSSVIMATMTSIRTRKIILKRTIILLCSSFGGIIDSYPREILSHSLTI